MSLHEPTDLTNCDREPIHIPGSIQPHGCLLACDSGASQILAHSANAAEMLGFAGAINGAVLQDVLGDKLTHDLRNALASTTDPSRPSPLIDVALPSGGRFDIAAHAFGSKVIIELEPASAGKKPTLLTRDMIGRVRDYQDMDHLVTQATRLLRAVLGYDRVMVYRFDRDGAGKVVSEARRSDLDSFLGQYFPASDIPRQARILYLKNPIRIISDASGERVPLIPPFDETGQPLDLSFSHLRSVSPIHCEYLRNMGVAASMSISLIVDGELWGLIACHHDAPKTLSLSHRISAEMFGEFFSLHLMALKQKNRLEAITRARRSLDRFLHLASHHSNLDHLFREGLPEFMNLLTCDGVGLWLNGSWSAHGAAPGKADIASFAPLVGNLCEGRVWATHKLSDHHRPAQDYNEIASGLIVLPLSHTPRDYLFFFRKEILQTLDWAGNPEKLWETGPLGDRLTPRKSFAIWKEAVHRQAEPWTDSDLEIAEAARSVMMEIVLRHNELMEDERQKSETRQRMLNEGLNHRVKNILTVIKSLVARPVKEDGGLVDYVTSLNDRIKTLAQAHDQVIRASGGGLLKDLLNSELMPYRDRSVEIRLSETPVWLDSRAYSVMALVLHELSANAARYGALSQGGGMLKVSWAMTANGDCEILWRESGGPPVAPPARKGFGTALVERSIPYDLGGQSAVDYAPEGLSARFVLPARFIATQEDPADTPDPAAPASRPSVAFALDTSISILLVEDQVLIAMDAESMLSDAGIERVVTANSAANALARLKDFTPDAGILDINLGNGTSMQLAEELHRRGIPFVFATGYDERLAVPDVFSNVLVVRKPYDEKTLTCALSACLARKSAV